MHIVCTHFMFIVRFLMIEFCKSRGENPHAQKKIYFTFTYTKSILENCFSIILPCPSLDPVLNIAYDLCYG